MLTGNQGTAERPIVAIHAGAGTPIKQWPAEHWAAVADRLADKLQASIIFTGSDQEHNQIWKIMDRMRRPGLSLGGQTKICQPPRPSSQPKILLAPPQA